MAVIYETNLCSGRLSVWIAPPFNEIIAIRDGDYLKITQVRWMLDFEDPKHPVQRQGLGRLIRQKLDVAFDNEPVDLVRCGYKLDDGTIIGDASLWPLLGPDDLLMEDAQFGEIVAVSRARSDD